MMSATFLRRVVLASVRTWGPEQAEPCAAIADTAAALAEAARKRRRVQWRDSERFSGECFGMSWIYGRLRTQSHSQKTKYG